MLKVLAVPNTEVVSCVGHATVSQLTFAINRSKDRFTWMLRKLKLETVTRVSLFQGMYLDLYCLAHRGTQTTLSNLYLQHI